MRPLSVDFLRECLDYKPDSGALIWRRRPEKHFCCGSKSAAHLAAIWNAKFSGKPAFASVGDHGYYTSAIGGRRMSAHRIVWAIYYGESPSFEIDHINGVRTDNRIENLRQVTRSENSKNLRVRSGEARGVYWYTPTSRWVAKIQYRGRMRHLGYFKDRDDAISARRAAEAKYGFHPNHGRAF